MAIERWELAQRQKGNVAGAEVAKALRDQYGDVPLHQSVYDVSREQPTDSSAVEMPSPELRAKLEQAGFTAIYPLTKQSIKTLRDEGKPFWSTWHNEYPELEALPSRGTWVAINPDQLFLPDSNRKTLKEQEQMVKKFSKDLKIDGVEAVIGEMPDYTELAFTHFDATGERLFGKNYSYNYARTKTPTSGSDVAVVGNFGADGGLVVSGWYRVRGDDHVFASPLVVPKA
ncbi:hypothetical protein A3G67_02820 [Candidatus Roizmanbacteria bacterium RIFCSPLOWO2_12_FULL_40_12]|uniref:Uncharacterized protein n=1 Tax=Candidatus Roizmanbacteria bacterium RIFCSPLOWO2_01_FULL_40_42 TaxID=1802066 RepID=A0A1F7J2R9_9BACT|nr:MAG: hypothetical protein A2779_00350 [Candidatus Roizmanbacteria bacterium RIFCSPHIGHO2_01_FULL_40_98]OGK27510.1 MAG: hypothetical protein A3C31_03505 [Candidatus Roizmanbacteria bacterium RIFCSPHIGHO2_02_FULL_40_53]OGK30266.1 MAG: hypothetical protein A2W49_00990 [Candidatus Roizmanbacteria bacterium RIFCSPHIGHO2_12_41_18]OGK37134.1 MAG: hypothetical protein A3E69_01605 [Candidatus Roizmanbacteria bacterium RIFCSPHIGHO2_12_FULL_40_130]OGK49872.1 MAG: hypothetical protein A3B50_03745 [Candi